MTSENRVVVTGMGIIAPNGANINDFCNSIMNGKSGIRFVQELSNLNFGCQVGGVPETVNSIYQSYIEKYHLETASLMVQWAIIAALEAWEDAKLTIPEYNSTETDYNTGIIIGSGIGSVDIFAEKIIPLTDQGNSKKLRSTIIEHSMLSAPGANLAGVLAVGNQVSFNSSACSTGTEAIILGSERIKYGKAKRMIVGGVDIYSPYCWSGFDAMRVLNRKGNNEPEKASRPMSASASGFVPGAGAGVLILEEMQQAVNRGAKIYGEIVGGYINCGGQRNGGTMTAPNSEGVVACIKGALADAQVEANQIDVISGHLSSTMADPIEIANWAKALNRKNANFPFVNSLKSMTGHCIGAAGAIETIAAFLQIKNQFIYPSINCEDLHPEITSLISEDKIPQKCKKDIEINYIAKASFGFGDVNSCLILKKI